MSLSKTKELGGGLGLALTQKKTQFAKLTFYLHTFSYTPSHITHTWIQNTSSGFGKYLDLLNV